MRVNLAAFAIGFGAFLVAISAVDLSLATDVAKAYLCLFCGGLFFSASISSRYGARIAMLGAEALAVFATFMVAGLVLFSLPFPISMLSVVSGQKVAIANLSQGPIIGPRVTITTDMVNSDLVFENSNVSGYRIVSETIARGLTAKAATRVLEKCRLQIYNGPGNISIRLTGPKRLQMRVKPRLVIQIPRNVTADVVVKLARGSLNLTGLMCGTVDASIKVGRVDARSLDAWTCDMFVENGPIKVEVAARKVKLRTIIGDISILSLRPETDCSTETVKGRIDTYLSFSDEVGYRVEADSIGGSIQINLTNVVLTKQKGGFISVKTRDFEDKKLTTTVLARTTAGNVTIAQI